MEFQTAYKIFQPNHLGEEKQQMLNLNRRLETYLSRVKLLEEENELLANEIKALRHDNQGALAHRRALEEELQRARLDVDVAWRERVLSEVEVEKMVEELQDLELLRQREAQAKAIAKSNLEQSRKELQEEERAQMWLREKVNQLEQEMTLLIQTHEEDVAHLEATTFQSRAVMPPAQAHRTNQAPDLLRMGQEFSQRATRAWQEAAGAFQGQVARLEESLEEARSRLYQVHQEKQESQLKLQTLKKEMASAQDVRLHLEKTVSQRREEHCQEIQHLQEHLEDLEMEKEKLAQQIAHLLQENRSLTQLKMSLGLEVTTYRALLDSEGLGADVPLSHKPRNISIRDAVSRPHGVKKNYQTQLSASFKTTFPSSVLGTTRSTGTAAQIRNTKPTTLNEIPKLSSKLAEMNTKKSVTLESGYPKSVQFEAAENLKSQDFHNKVTDAKPLSSCNEQGTPFDSLEVNDEEEKNINVEPAEEQIVESVISQKVESGLRNEALLEDEASLCHFITPSLALCSFQEEEELNRVSDKPEQVNFEGESEKEDVLQPQTQDSVFMMTQHVDKEAEHVQEETSDSETEAMLEPTIESRPSSPESECESIETVFNQETDPSIDKNISNDPSVMIKQELSSAMVGTNRQEVEDKLYPDGEEMDTWDSVIERKVNVTVDEMKNEGKKQHAEPEEDISAKELEEEKIEAFQIDNKASSVMLTQVDEGQDTLDQRNASSPDKEEENDEEDSQNVSLSWRTELESDSYAQENTLADTRPLIRYKSDDTQASHIDESESSEGEQEKKMDEAGMGTWSDSKSKTFGTMEDLCEEVEEETIDEDYNLGYTHVEDRDVSQHRVESEHVTEVTDRENADETVKNGSEELLEKETEELLGADVHTDVDNDKELATDKLVANLSTDRYGVHFAEQQFREEILQMDDKCVEEVDEQAEHEKEKTYSLSENHTRIKSTLDQALENQMFRDPYAAMYPSNATAEEEVQHNDQQTTDKLEKEEEVEHNIHTMHDADPTEDQPIVSDFINKSKLEDMDDTKNAEDPNPVVQVEANQKNLHDIPATTEALPEETPRDGQEHVNEDDKDIHKFPAETAEWDVLENQMFRDPYAAVFQSNTTAEEEVQHNNLQTMDKPEEEGEHSKRIVHDTDATEDQSGFTDFINKPEMEDMEDTPILGNLNPVVLVEADQKNMHDIPATTEAIPEKTPKDGQEHVKEDDEDFHKFAVETVECEVLENQMFSVPYTTMYPSNIAAEEEVQHKDQQTMDELEKEAGEHNKHTVHDTDATEDQSAFTDFINRPAIEDKGDTKNPEDPNPVLVEADPKNLFNIPDAPEALPEETPKDCQEHVIEDDEDFHKFPAETLELEVLVNPTQDQNKQDQSNENMPELADDDVVIHQKELVKSSSDSVPSQTDIFIMKNATDSSLHNLFTSDVKKDFWVSSLESGATYKPDDACNKAAEKPNQNQDFTDNQIWGNLENRNVINGNSKSDVDSSKDMEAMKEQEQIHVEVKKVLVHSEESEVEAESWSSGEEAV